MAFDIEGARAAGYSDGEIADFLGKDSGFDVAGAQKAGYAPAEIVAHLSSLKKPAAPAAATDAEPSTKPRGEIDYGNAQGFSASEIVDMPLKAGGMGSVLESRAADRPEDPLTLDQLRALEKRPVPRAGEQTAAPIKGKTIPVNRDGTLGRAGSLVGAQLDSYSAGLGYKLGDAASAVGADAVAKDLRGRASNLEGRADQTNKSVSLSADGAFEKYAPQILAVFPTMAVAAATGGLPVMFGISEVQSYAEGRKAGLSPAAALGRAVPMGAAEVIGEKLGGTGKLLEALEKAAIKGGSLESLKELSGRLAASGMREVPSEEATYAMQFGIDKAPGIGLKPNAGMADFLEGAKDTAIVAAGAGGMMAGGSMAVNRLAARAKAFAEKYPTDPGTLPGVPPAPVDPVAAIGKAQSVDEAIAVAQAALQSSTAVDNIGEILKQNLPSAQSTPALAATENIAGLSPDVAQTTQAITELEAANVSPPPASPLADAAALPALDEVPAGTAAGDAAQPAGPGALLEAVPAEPGAGALTESPNVQNQTPARPAAQGQTAPDQTPETGAVAGSPAAAAGTQAGNPGVQAAGVDQRLVPLSKRVKLDAEQATPGADPAADAKVEAVTGEPLDKQWTAFAPDSGTLAVPRADMPQIKAEHRGAMVNFLNARDIAHTQEEVPVGSLKPTQTEFSPEKVRKALDFTGNDRSILVSSDNHVLDGHHQWLAKLESGEDYVKVIRLDAPIKQLLETVKEFPSAEQARGATATQQRADFAASEKTRKVPGTAARTRAHVENPFKAFLGKHGISNSLAAEFAPGRKERQAAMVQGYGPMFRKSGPLLDALAARAVEEGFLLTPDEAKLQALITDALRGKRIIPQYAQGVAEDEGMARAARAADLEQQDAEAQNAEVEAKNQAERDAIQAVADLPDTALEFLSDADIVLTASNNVSEADFLRALGATEQEIEDATAKQSEGTRQGDQGRAGAEETAASAAPGNPQGRDSQAGDGEGLTSPTPADVLAQQQRAAEGDKAAAKTTTAAADRARADAELPDFTLTGSTRAADADPNQGLMFSRAAKATDILDAADIKGKDRLEALRDVRAGLITPDELEAAYPAKEQIHFSRAAKAEDTKDLVIQHNLTAENLLFADRMGGLAVPSLAITKADQPMQNFGEITLLGDRNMADPRQGIKAYGADIYSPRYPQISYQLERPALAKLNAALAPYRKEGDREIYGGEITLVDDLTSDKAFKAYADADGRANWADMKAKAVAMLQDVGAGERLFQGFTYSGNRRYKPHTLENVIAILKKELRGGENFNYGAGSLRAKFTPQFRSIDAIKKAKGSLVTKEQFEAIKDEVNNELVSIAEDMNKPTDTVIAIFEDAPRMGLRRAASQYDVDLGDEMTSRMAEFLTRLRNMPTEYFEGKMLRSVGIGEFKAAVVPSGVKPAVLSLLEREGVKVFTYKKGDEADRAGVIKKAAVATPDAMFSRAPLEPVQTKSGATAFKTPEIALANPRLNVRQPGGAVTRIDFEIRDRAIYARAIKDGDTPAQAKEEATVGIITLDIDAAGVFKSLRNIEVFQSKRGAGIAEKVVGGIVESLPAGAALNIHDILPTATGFWDKMGAKFPRSEDTVVTANLTPEQFRSAYDSRTRTAGTQGQRQESRTAQYAGAGSGRPGADGTPAPRAAVRNPSTVERVQAAVAELIGGKQLPNKLGRVIVATSADVKSHWLPLMGKNAQLGSEGEAGVAQAFFEPATKSVVLIADNIPAGDETAVAAHELMHKHGQAVLGAEGWDKLHTTINSWANAPEDSDERAVYTYARSRVEAVGMELSSQEMFPYAVEAAIKMGVKPSLIAKTGTVARWLGSVKYAMQQAWGKVTGKPETFKTQDLVDLAFGIAQMENPESAAAMGRITDAPVKTDSPEFERWFGESKVVDSDGNPQIVYHGTSSSQEGEAFSSFDTYASNYGLMGMGGYFTADPAVASSYTTKSRGATPTVYPAYLSIKNPIDMEAPADVPAWEKQFDDIEQYHEGGDTNEAWYRAAESSIADQEIPMYEGAEIMQDGLRAMGFDGITHVGGGRVQKDGARHRVYVAFDPEQVKSATGNNGDFDGSNPDIRFSRTATQTGTPATQPNLSPWRDETGRLQFAPGAWLYDRIGKAASPMLVRLGMKAATPELRRQLRQMKIDVEKAQEVAVAIARETTKLSEAERAMVSDLVEQELKVGVIPPAHAIKLAAMINDAMGRQTDELVSLGMLTKDSADKWRGKYLPRYYESKLKDKLAKTGATWADALMGLTGRQSVMKGIKGKNLKGRGLYETIPEAELPNYEALGWEVRDPDYTPSLPTVDGTVQVWRDFSPAEREKMGEIRDAGFRFVMGYMQTQRDIALGRMFERMAQDPDSSSRLEKEGYVQVPTTVVSGTGAKVYGKLAGRWVPAETMSQLSNIEESTSAAWQMYRKAMAVWKMGKALALDTPLPTPTGWTTMGEVQVGDTVFDEQGNPCKVTYATGVQLDRECYEVEFSDGNKIVADAEHLWFTMYNGKGSVKNTKQILDTLKERTRGDNKHSIPTAGPLQTAAAELPIHPYVLGVWLGDGCKASARVTAGSADSGELLKNLEGAGVIPGAIHQDNRSSAQTFQMRLRKVGCLRGHGPEHMRRNGCGACDTERQRCLKSGKPMAPAVNGQLNRRLRDHGLLGNKHVPAVYLRASEAQRRELLQGLMDTDGSITDPGQCEFTTTLPALRDGMMELLRSLGYKPTCAEQCAMLNGNDHGPKWRISFKAYSNEPVFKMKRKADRLGPAPTTRQRSGTRQIVAVRAVPSVPVKCIEVDSESHLYLAGEGMIPTHNTAMNPVSHVNNVVSNLTMAHLAGVSYLRGDKYLAAARDFVKKTPMLQEAKDNGLFLGTLSDTELMNSMPEELRILAQKQESTTLKVARTGFDIMTMFLRKPMGAAYQAEDTFFRYLIYKDARERGTDPQDAVDYAQRYIFTYDDLPKGARRIRDFGIPFFSYTYKAAPALLHTALTHPLRMAAPAAVLWGINAAAYAIATGDDDDDWQESLKKYITDPEFRAKAREQEKLEREHLPPWNKGTTALLTPKMIRLGMDEVTKLPLFIDVSRITPGGDMFDVSPNAGGIPLPQPITPSHPLFTTAVAMLANRDLFRGKELTDSNDTTGEKAAKRAEWLWTQLAPAVAAGNYHFEKGMNALAQASGGEITWLPEGISERYTGIGRDGLPVQPKLAAAQTFGIKIRPIDLDTSAAIDGSLKQKMIRDIDTEIRALKRLSSKGAISEKTLDKARDLAKVKKDRIRDDKTVDGDDRP